MAATALPQPELVSAGDISLSVTDVGTGHPVLWLHGSGPGASGVSNFASNLPAFSDFRNLVIDHPRYGLSDRPHIEGPLIHHSGEHMLRALDTLSIEKFAIVGNSFGGGVAAWMAATAPDRVTAIVLMAPGGMQPEGMTVADLPYGLQLIFRAMRDGVDREHMAEFVDTMCVNKSLVTDALIDQRLEAAVRNNPEWEGPPNIGNLTDLVPNITAPTQLLWGKQDQFVPAAWSLNWLERIPQSELHILPDCGHWLQYERQAQFNELAGEFLRRNTK
jgi:pimeloyl-ACP methyl ester carboxylesterase